MNKLLLLVAVLCILYADVSSKTFCVRSGSRYIYLPNEDGTCLPKDSTVDVGEEIMREPRTLKNNGYHYGPYHGYGEGRPEGYGEGYSHPHGHSEGYGEARPEGYGEGYGEAYGEGYGVEALDDGEGYGESYGEGYSESYPEGRPKSHLGKQAYQRALAQLIADSCLSDEDGDGYWAGIEGPGGDCDDTRADVNPGVCEECDGVDNDCNGIIDDLPECDENTNMGDLDMDGLANQFDSCPNTPPVTPGEFPDTDGDGLGDECDPCPDSANNKVDSFGVCVSSYYTTLTITEIVFDPFQDPNQWIHHDLATNPENPESAIPFQAFEVFNPTQKVLDLTGWVVTAGGVDTTLVNTPWALIPDPANAGAYVGNGQGLRADCLLVLPGQSFVFCYGPPIDYIVGQSDSPTTGQPNYDNVLFRPTTHNDQTTLDQRQICQYILTDPIAVADVSSATSSFNTVNFDISISDSSMDLQDQVAGSIIDSSSLGIQLDPNFYNYRLNYFEVPAMNAQPSDKAFTNLYDYWCRIGATRNSIDETVVPPASPAAGSVADNSYNVIEGTLGMVNRACPGFPMTQLRATHVYPERSRAGEEITIRGSFGSFQTWDLNLAPDEPVQICETTDQTGVYVQCSDCPLTSSSVESLVCELPSGIAPGCYSIVIRGATLDEDGNPLDKIEIMEGITYEK